ncbi:MAG: conjugative transposon protein TraM [Raineya sp.]|jgi:hypothetical protein|nr:conjugative transposon protein TraM [Raineya sp.]
MEKKKVNGVWKIIAGFVVVVLVFVAVASSGGEDSDSAISELEKDSVGLKLAKDDKDKIGEYQKGYNDSKNPKIESVTPKFNIEESNLSEGKSDSKESEKEKENPNSDKQVGGSYSSPYKETGSNKTETNKTTTTSEPEEENVFNSTSRTTAKTASKYRAVIHGDQKTRQGGSVAIRIQEDAVIGGSKVPRNTIFYGTITSAGSGRLMISVSNFKTASGEGIVFDTDNMAGIRYDQEGDSSVESEGKAIGKEILGDAIRKLPGGKYADRLMRSAKGKDGSIYLIDGYKIQVQAK